MVRIRGYYGRTNNFLIELATALSYTATHEPPLALALSDAYTHGGQRVTRGSVAATSFLQRFDVAAATRGWACVLNASAADASGLEEKAIPAKVIFWSPSQGYDRGLQGSLGLAFRGRVLRQLLLRPEATMRARVEEFERAHGLVGGYNAVHLRWLEGECIERVLKPCVLEQQRVPNASADDVCHMSDDYVRRALRQANALGRPLVLAHDGQQPTRAAELARSLSAVSYDGTDGVEVDMLLLMRASYFVGNPASTLSWNVAMVRADAGLTSNLLTGAEYDALYVDVTSCSLPQKSVP